MTKCQEVMTPNPVCCLSSDKVDRAAQIMKAEDVGSIPVIEGLQARRVVGIVTDRDIVLKVVANGRDPENVFVNEIMTGRPVTCRLDDDLQHLLHAMAEHQVRRIPIVDIQNRIVGIVAQGDVATRMEEPVKTAEVVRKISRPTVEA
ncbi:MAG TPA: CBS domain-containing protein [Terriglobia bacterium]|nr:CBS domain-containing protein [Terriglobia bacterium]